MKFLKINFLDVIIAICSLIIALNYIFQKNYHAFFWCVVSLVLFGLIYLCHFVMKHYIEKSEKLEQELENKNKQQ